MEISGDTTAVKIQSANENLAAGASKISNDLRKNALDSGSNNAVSTSLDESDLTQAVNSVEQFTRTYMDASVKFSIDDQLGRTIITVLEPETDKVIRQFPPEEFLQVARTISEMTDLSDKDMLIGILFDQHT